MKIPISWLKKYVPITISSKELAERLTMAGVEVGEIQEIGENWDSDKIVVGYVRSIKAHPNADRLKLPTVELSDGECLTVVCGAPNVNSGQKIAFAREGAVLYSPRSGKTGPMKASTIRGVKSSGMVCSALELGIGDDHEGILVLEDDAPIGMPLKEYMGDSILDIEVTPNRPDCLSILGLAHEVAALTDEQVTEPNSSYEELGDDIESQVTINLDSSNLCNRYTAALITGITVAESPAWMQEALIKAGQRPINNVVDITNYVMLEYGQPLHAFDFEKVENSKVIVRVAQPNETLITLDGSTRSLKPTMLTISDDKKAIGLAGIIGGISTEICQSSTSLLLESANFNSVSIRQTRGDLGLNTEASYRFERGIRSALTSKALKRAIHLVLELAGGNVSKGIIDIKVQSEEDASIKISRSRIKQVLGVDYSMSEIRKVLESLGFKEGNAPEKLIDIFDSIESSPVVEHDSAIWVKPPYWRSDISIEEDIIEEIARIIGYDTIPTTMLSSSLPHHVPQPLTELKESIKDCLVSAGMRETLSYPLTTLELLERANIPGDLTPLRIANPMSREFEFLRTSLRGSILKTLSDNTRTTLKDGARLFEIGRIYVRSDENGKDLPKELEMLVGVIAGPRYPLSWLSQETDMNFFDGKGILTSMFEQLNVDAKYSRAIDSTMHPDKVAHIDINNRNVGVIGELNPAVAQRFNLETITTTLFEINLEALLNSISTNQPNYESFNRYPESYRDIALILDKDVSSGEVQRIINRHKMVTRSIPFDVYSGEGISHGKKSTAYRIIFQSDRGTLNSKQIDRVQGDIVRQLTRELGADLRVS